MRDRSLIAENHAPRAPGGASAKMHLTRDSFAPFCATNRLTLYGSRRSGDRVSGRFRVFRLRPEPGAGIMEPSPG